MIWMYRLVRHLGETYLIRSGTTYCTLPGVVNVRCIFGRLCQNRSQCDQSGRGLLAQKYLRLCTEVVVVHALFEGERLAAESALHLVPRHPEPERLAADVWLYLVIHFAFIIRSIT